MGSLTLEEKVLYHQIHPLKLVVDWGTGLAALFFFWSHSMVAGLIIAFIPSLLVSFLLVGFIDLENYKNSRFGRYVAKYMRQIAQQARLVGYVGMALGAWFHMVWILVLGLVVIVVSWTWGLAAHE